MFFGCQHACGEHAEQPAQSGRSYVAGADSFTEGSSQITGLRHAASPMLPGSRRTAYGVWRGTATQGGKSVKVSVDFQGNVVSQ